MKIILYYNMAYNVTNKEYKRYLKEFISNDGLNGEIKTTRISETKNFTDLTVEDAREYLKNI